MNALNAAELRVTPSVRSGTSAAARYRQAGNAIPAGADVDHIIDLQLGGADIISNLRPLDLSVNRSLGAQIGRQLRGVPSGTKVSGIRIVH